MNNNVPKNIRARARASTHRKSIENHDTGEKKIEKKTNVDFKMISSFIFESMEKNILGKVANYMLHTEYNLLMHADF